MQKEILFQIIRQVEVDTLSNLLAILDGTSMLEKQTDEFKLTVGDNDEGINGELQDIFLEMEEN